jgi:hypothetical protein
MSRKTLVRRSPRPHALAGALALALAACSDEAGTAACADGGHAPRTSCRDILASGESMGDGIYWITPPGAEDPIMIQCDMSADGGGWTLAASWHLADNAVGAQWITGAGVGSSYAAADTTFKMPDTWIRALAGERYRVQAAGLACNHGVDVDRCEPGDIPSYTRFWGAGCAYDSTLNQPPCDEAYADPGLLTPAPPSATQTCAWHHGLNSAMSCPLGVQEVVTDHADTFFGPAVCVGQDGAHACAILEMALLRLWVR